MLLDLSLGENSSSLTEILRCLIRSCKRFSPIRWQFFLKSPHHLTLFDHSFLRAGFRQSCHLTCPDWTGICIAGSLTKFPTFWKCVSHSTARSAAAGTDATITRSNTIFAASPGSAPEQAKFQPGQIGTSAFLMIMINDMAHFYPFAVVMN